jgi:hypothetical protein
MDTLKVEGIVGESIEMQACLSKLSEVSKSTMPILISGEIGTGKELFAQRIHEKSRLQDRPFRIFGDLCSLNPFSNIWDANICEVKGGTLAFHDIDTLEIASQDYLATLLFKQEHRSQFGETERPFRVIATTTKSLQDMVLKGAFSEELYQYISEFHIHLPPLKERSTDIEAIVNYHLKTMGSGKSSTKKEYRPEFISALKKYNWPHNIKELIEVLQVSVRNSEDERKLETKHLPLNIYRPEKQPISVPKHLLAELKDSNGTRTGENKSSKYSKEEYTENSLEKRDDTKPMLCFYKDDDYWHIGKLGDERRFQDFKGIRVIHQLLLRPNEWIGSGLLSRVADKSGTTTNGEIEKMWEYGSLGIRNDIDGRIHACVFDETSKSQLIAARKALESEIEEMEISGENPEELVEKKDNLKFLKKHLKGGKQPDRSSQDEKARSAIQKNIKLVRDKIVKKLPYMKWHLERVTTKYHCIYESEGENEPQWILQKDVFDRRINET